MIYKAYLRKMILLLAFHINQYLNVNSITTPLIMEK